MNSTTPGAPRFFTHWLNSSSRAATCSARNATASATSAMPSAIHFSAPPDFFCAAVSIISSASRPLVEPPEDFLRARRQALSVEFVAGFAREFGEGRIGMDRRGDRGKADLLFHCEHEFVQQIARVRADQRDAEN